MNAITEAPAPPTPEQEAEILQIMERIGEAIEGTDASYAAVALINCILQAAMCGTPPLRSMLVESLAQLGAHIERIDVQSH